MFKRQINAFIVLHVIHRFIIQLCKYVSLCCSLNYTEDNFTFFKESIPCQTVSTRGLGWPAAYPSLKSIEKQLDQSASSVKRLTPGNILRDNCLFHSLSFALPSP